MANENEVPGDAGYDPQKFKSGSKVCPLLKISCLKTGCAWWVNSVSRCSVKYMIAGKSAELNK